MPDKQSDPSWTHPGFLVLRPQRRIGIIRRIRCWLEDRRLNRADRRDEQKSWDGHPDCQWCHQAPGSPAVNKRGQLCPCRCHGPNEWRS